MESENNLKNFPVFIVGMPRSGTTILSNLLNATQNIYFPPETHYYQLIKKFHSKKSKNPYLDFINLTRNKYFSEFKFSDYEIDNLKPNTTYLLKLRGFNKYGYGDWTKVYQFVTKLTSFAFNDEVISFVVPSPLPN